MIIKLFGSDMGAKRDPRKFVVVWLLFLIFSIPILAGTLTPSQVSVQISATWSESPPQITLNWFPDQGATQYFIAKKNLGADVWTPQVALPAGVYSWTDTNVQTSFAYEYQVRKGMGDLPDGYGYICAGIRVAPVESRGKLILLVEESLAGPLSLGLARLQQDLTGEGWQVIRHNVSASASPAATKALIKADYLADPVNTSALLLFGHIPVPYSGYIAPDGHDDHRGAWPADVYYGEFDGAWTDTSVIATNTASPSNRNVPGDGKFDQSHPPGKVRLQIGRVDLSNLTCFANKVPARSEIDLTRQYLAKDHAFRHAQLDVPRRAILYSTFGGLEEEPTVATALRSFNSFFGTNDMKYIGPNQFLPILNTNAYLWAFVATSGSETIMNAVASSDDFALNDPKVVFTSFMGSYFGDWDRESNILRASLGTGTHLLTSFYGGQPQWILHTMSLGGTIGECALITQNNGSRGVYMPHRNFGVGEVHISLMGDPTLRLHPVGSPSRLAVANADGGRRLQWIGSSDTIQGYFVYKSSAAGGPYARISGPNPVAAATFLDPVGASSDFYMVRAVKLENTPAGSYFNLSQGAFYPDPLVSEIPDQPRNLFVSQIIPGGVKVQWLEQSAAAANYQIERRSLSDAAFQIVAIVGGVEDSYLDHPPGHGSYIYRVKSLANAGDSVYSDELAVDLQDPAGDLIQVNAAQDGDWRGAYGQEGYIVMGASTNLPSFVSIGTSNANFFVLQWNSDDPRASMRPDGGSGIFAYWVAPQGALQLSLRFSDSTAHRVALYIGSPKGSPGGRADVIDPFTGALMETMSFARQTNSGSYLVFDLLNYADIKIFSGVTNETAFVNGIFFSKASLDQPAISPSSGEFPGKATVAMQSTPGAQIRFTTDHTVPTAASTLYTGPFLLTTNISIIARAFKEGYSPSLFGAVSLTNSLRTIAAFSSTDAATRGDWFQEYGDDGYWIAGAGTAIPSFAEMNFNEATFLWSDDTTESRALRKNPQTANRLAACWFSGSELNLNLTLYSEELHSVALYFLDWDRAGRVQEITITDPSGTVLDQRVIDNFGDGKYFLWNASGSLRIRIRRVAGPNATLSGIFISPKIGISAAPAHLAPAQINSGGPFQMQMAGQPGQTFDIQYTTDFRNWTSIGRQILSGPFLDIQVPREGTAHFYRAVLVP